MAICTGVTPNLSWNLFPSSCSSSMVVSSLITTTPSRRGSALAHFAPGLSLLTRADIWERRSPSEGTALHHCVERRKVGAHSREPFLACYVSPRTACRVGGGSMSVLPLSLFYGSRAEPRGGFLGRGLLPKREVQREGSLSWSGSWGEVPSGFLGHSHKPPGRAHNYEVV